eukprot:CAMPEP_0178412632 /NCGR_PEP_ID=MMETSP0689_2-20121128/22114_1 /TAXON_ID=160604 /ORGANISM="Amphidinium massartii, Strain CS-259" /LENGTH=370 /DNA_ID=CAMNT_0020033883 /DNA_START=27 /DNA_END=1135 /DNA_ORIENTATION=-
MLQMHDVKRRALRWGSLAQLRAHRAIATPPSPVMTVRSPSCASSALPAASPSSTSLFGSKSACDLSFGTKRASSALSRAPSTKFFGLNSGDASLSFAFAAACKPHPEKLERGGEDSFFACPDSGCFGIADGVGGWASAGIDPGAFARKFLQYAYDDIQRQGSCADVNLQQVFREAAVRLQQERIMGSSTSLLGQLCGSTLAILNLGDSGVILLRPALRTSNSNAEQIMFPRVVFRSSDQTHYFNCPYQLGSAGPPPEEPDLIFVRVQPGDIVIAASDGIFDNLFDHQVQAIVAHHLAMPWKMEAEVEPFLPDVATGIAEHARNVGLQENRRETITPFALTAQSEGLNFHGGKLDDISLVVGLVQEGGHLL